MILSRFNPIRLNLCASLKLLSQNFKALKSFIPSQAIWKSPQICKCYFRNLKWDSFGPICYFSKLWCFLNGIWMKCLRLQSEKKSSRTWISLIREQFPTFFEMSHPNILDRKNYLLNFHKRVPNHSNSTKRLFIFTDRQGRKICFTLVRTIVSIICPKKKFKWLPIGQYIYVELQDQWNGPYFFS